MAKYFDVIASSGKVWNAIGWKLEANEANDICDSFNFRAQNRKKFSSAAFVIDHGTYQKEHVKFSGNCKVGNGKRMSVNPYAMTTAEREAAGLPKFKTKPMPPRRSRVILGCTEPVRLEFE